MSLPDRNKLLIAGGVVVVAILVLVFVLLRGRGAKEETAGAGGGFAVPTAAGAPGATGTAAAPAAPGAPGAAPAAGGAAPAAAGAGQAEAPTAGGAPLVGLVRMDLGSEALTRRDPFLTFEPPPQPTPPELIANLPPVNLQTGGLRPPGIEASQIGRRRVAGVLFNDRAVAVLEKDNEYFVVKPGDVVDGIRVTAIAADGIFIEDADGIRWRVPLRFKGPGPSASASLSGTSAAASQTP